MNPKKLSKELLGLTLQKTEFKGLAKPIQGKVRDIYDLGPELLIVTTDRISAFDVVLDTIPCKGQVLNAIAAHGFKNTSDIIANHVISVPDPCAMVVKKLKPIMVEVIVRRYLTGSLWRDYQAGKRDEYGFELPANMRADQRFEKLILTPTTKAEIGGHDMPLSNAQVIASGLAEKTLWAQIEKTALDLFRRGEKEANANGLILVDTKYEFGLDDDRLLVMDEIHTPDSSRYWEAKEYQNRFDAGQNQKMLDKENIRQWLIERGFSGQGETPTLTDEVRLELAKTYMNLQERLCKTPVELPTSNPQDRLRANLIRAGIL
jgi:phosphoribosylaminoimidazole-succinocarboxamide synthase